MFDESFNSDSKDADAEVSRKRTKLEHKHSVTGESFSNMGDISSLDMMTNASIASSTVDSVISPWESRELKVDLIESRARISLLMQQIERQHQIKANLETMYQGQIDGLTKQEDYMTKKIANLEKHLQVMRKRESQAKLDLVKVQNKAATQRQHLEDQLSECHRINADMKNSFQEATNDMQNEISQLKRDFTTTLKNLSTTSEELEAMKKLNSNMQNRLKSITDLENQLSDEQEQLRTALLRIKELQFEIDSYGEWKDVSRQSLGRLSNMGDLEKEVIRLRTELKSMHEAVGNKLLLEEQVFDLQGRLERQDKQLVDLVQLKVKVDELDREVKEWRGVAADHVKTETAITPLTLRTRIEELLKTHVVLANDQQTDQMRRQWLDNETRDLQMQLQLHKQSMDEVKAALSHQQLMFQRAKKKLILVIKERDFYKQVMENYEKEVTISTSGNSTNVANFIDETSQIKLRVEMLEKSLLGYKEMCESLERDLQVALGDSSSALPFRDQAERFRQEINDLTLENDRLKRRKEELELKVDQLTLRQSGAHSNDERPVEVVTERRPFKIVHFQQNPADLAYESRRNEVEKLQAEIERLRRKIRKMESDKEELSCRFNDTTSGAGGLTMNIKETNDLRSQLESLESKNKHLKEFYKEATLQFREIVYMLFGYRVDRTTKTHYRVSSMYANDEGEFLNFELKETGQIDMLGTDYSLSLTEFTEQLRVHNSMPVFLSSLTLELFNKTTLAH